MPGQKRPAGELDGSPLSGGGVNVRSCVGAACKYCGLCRNGSGGLKATMTNAPINMATPIATRDKKNLIIYSGGLSSLLFSQAMCDIIGSPSASSTRSHVGHSNVRRTEPAGPGSIRASIMRAWHLRQRGRSIGISDGSTGPNTVMLLDQAVTIRAYSRRPRVCVHLSTQVDEVRAGPYHAAMRL
jgi:hypothetical protein